MNSNNRTMYAYSVKESDKMEKPVFSRAGIAIINLDGSLNIVLDVFPLNGRIHLTTKKIEGSSNENK